MLCQMSTKWRRLATNLVPNIVDFCYGFMQKGNKQFDILPNCNL